MKWFNLEDNVNLLSIIAAIVLVVVTIAVVGLCVRKMKTEKSSGELKEGVEYDGIKEYKNPLPIGWAVTYILMLVWAIWYFLFGYPLNSYSQIGAYNEEVKAYNQKFEQTFASPDKDTLLAIGKGIFLVECSACHGITGDGVNGVATDLTIWGSEAGIIDVIKKGSKGLNYPLGEMTADNVTGDDVISVAAFMAKNISALHDTKNPNRVSQGSESWMICAACHGEDGKGMEGMAPDLTKYGSADFVVDVLNKGKQGFIGEMPAFNDGRLTDVQKRAVGEYVISLSKDN